MADAELKKQEEKFERERSDVAGQRLKKEQHYAAQAERRRRSRERYVLSFLLRFNKLSLRNDLLNWMGIFRPLKDYSNEELDPNFLFYIIEQTLFDYSFRFPFG